MDHRAIVEQLDRERRNLARDGEVLEVLPDVTRGRTAHGPRHWVIYSKLTEATADDAIEREVAHHRRLGVGFEWKVFSHDRPPDLTERLARRGFEIGPREAVLVYELSRPAAWATQGAVDVMRVDRPADVPIFRRAAETIFAKDYSPTSAELTAAIEAGSFQHRAYVAMADGRAVSIGRLYTHPDSAFAGLYGGGTLAAYRGRGLYRAVVAARARDAIAAGAKYLVVDALPTSRPILESLGFQPVAETWPCDWRPEAAV